MSFVHQAQGRIEETGDRATPARVRVLAFLLAQHAAVTHHHIEVALDRQEKIDRVTLYRTLDWLTGKGLVHKVVSLDRAWLFRVNDSDLGHHRHAHFKCQDCAKVICLDEPPADRTVPPVPAGYRALEVEVTVTGLCPRCA
jgi:Fur family ferric uptake transcriptional regulator